MPSGEDAIRKKKNKSIRKKLRSESNKVSNRIAAIIAQKKRRQSGKRRMCQGMCFSLPTLEDPFNDKLMNNDIKKKDKTKKIKKDNVTEKGSDVSQNKRKANQSMGSKGKGKELKRARVENESTQWDKKRSDTNLNGNVTKDEGCPSKFLISCLKTVQDMMHHSEAFERGKPLFFDSWGFEFWRCHSSGTHVLETSGGASMEQIAWIGASAIDTITRKEKEGVSFTNPYLLFLVPSQEKATQVRAVCKPMKAFGIHTVSLHPGASVDHQIHGLKTCEPEFLVCTPDRLLELVSMEAVDISGVCSLIIDGLDPSTGDAYLDSIKSIRKLISVDPHTVLFCSGLNDAYSSAISSLLPSPMCKPPPAGPASSGSNLSRPRLMKMRKQTTSYNNNNNYSYANNPRFTRRPEDVDSGLGFNPFRTGSSTFSLGAGNGSSSSNVVDSVSVLDDLRKMQIDSDGSVSNVKFKFNAGESEGKNWFDESLDDQLLKEVDKLKIGESGNVGSVKSRVMNPFGGNVEMDLHNEMDKMNLGKTDGKAFVFGRSKADLIPDKMGELKVGGGRVDKEKIFVFGSNGKTGDGFSVASEGVNSENRFKEEVKDDLISDRMRELKVGGAGENFVFGQNAEQQKVYESASSSSQPFGSVSFTSRPEKNVGFTFSSKGDNIGAANFGLKTPDIKGGLFSGVKSIPEAKLKKKKGKVRKPVISHPRPKQDFVFGQGSSPETRESFEAYSPMDVSPYQETLADNYSRGTSVTSDDATSLMNDQNSVSSESHIINSNTTTDEDFLAATQRLNVNDGDVECEVSEVETFKSAMDNLEFSSDSFATALDSDLSSTATSGSRDKTGTRLFKFGSKLENISNDNFTFAASTSGQGQSSPEARLHKKKHRLKTGQDSYSPRSDTQNSYASSSSSSILSPVRTQKVDTSTLSSKAKDNYKPINKHHLKNGTFSTASASIAAEEACEKWRLRGNQAYGSGELAKAEDYYTQGLNSVSETEKSKGCLRALMLCYSNRAATRISLGRMKEALKDCLMAEAIDPNFVKVQVRAAHCYLAIGEVEKATLQYMKCLQSGSDVCVDRKLLVEASEGLEKAQKVTECLKQYTELSRKTPDDIEYGLRVINEALQISSYSEQLLQMKADTLLMLRRYEQIIQLCEQTLSSAEIETPTSSSSWRSNLIVKSYFYLGRLEEAHEFIKKQESSDHITERLESMRLESVIPLADTIRELLSRKAAGNEAYKARKYADAVEQYTSAIACSIESRPFAAICFCNRAAAYRALGQITDAIADCSLAIALDPSYLKAIYRRASLYEMIRDYEQAAIDLQKSVSLLTSQMEEKGILSGVADKSSGMNELRQTQLRLYNIEEESRKGIPLNMYLILGVESTAAASEVKKAYRKAALKHHPDKAALSVSRCDNGDDGVWKEIAENVHKDADRLFKMIGEAYAVLSNPSKRSEYDMDEEMRNEVNKFTRSSSGRMAADVQSPVFERSGRWQDSFRPFVDSQSKSYRYSRYS